MPSNAYSIIAATCHGNRGAEAMLETVVGRLREAQPDLRFHVFTYYPEADRQLVQDPALTLHSSTPMALVAWLLPWSLVFGLLRLVFGRRVLRMAPAAVRGLGESRALVDLAGVAFIDGREKFLPFNVLTLLPAWLLGTPVVKMPQAVGPFERPLNRLAARVVLPMCAMIWARGGRTREHLEQAAFPGVRFIQADDIAFNHKNGYSLTQEEGGALDARFAALASARGVSGVTGVVGLCPSSVVAVKARKEGGAYEDILARLVADLSGSGYLVVLFPNATRDAAGEAERNNDLPLIRRILAAAGTSLPVTPLAFDLDMNAAAIKRLIAEMDVVLVSRFHAMVGALALGVPAAVLGWSHKYAEVMARFGLEGNVMDYKQLSGPALRERVDAIFQSRQAMRAQILERLPEVKASAERPVVALLEPGFGSGGLA
ncbi:polysaccharide pyruvyl transferase family protein [Coralloluteibacterium stylophorae]|uniref:Polysaccharide pyruvyl transferase family protein n=1 Tax=Coralloluteibacterium stylophorae TaxID=1776034 RepID=A0A8J7VUF2_9GAMM|nr:polysaccharide pyruvyl transferase family protein [Coralloluteibacterium stylophorae]